jgi:zinc transport system permease protein
LLGILAAEVAAIAGVTLSYMYGLAAGGSIVVAAIGLYAVILVGLPLGKRGLAWTARRDSARPMETDNTLTADGGDE